ncbi:MAG: hypothetical protein HQM08_07520 [Candidatus Riflebacteria bacterium]|nr:hypothetical protein [Candidatus Riflebacteria bacterium]
MNINSLHTIIFLGLFFGVILFFGIFQIALAQEKSTTTLEPPANTPVQGN